MVDGHVAARKRAVWVLVQEPAPYLHAAPVLGLRLLRLAPLTVQVADAPEVKHPVALVLHEEYLSNLTFLLGLRRVLLKRGPPAACVAVADLAGACERLQRRVHLAEVGLCLPKVLQVAV